jgi:TolB-like protein
MSATTIVLQRFENLSGDAAGDLLARGLAYDLATELARFATIEVVPPSSADHVISTFDESREVSPLLLLEGSVRQIGGRRRLAVQLSERTSGRQMWADHVDADASDILVQSNSQHRRGAVDAPSACMRGGPSPSAGAHRR